MFDGRFVGFADFLLLDEDRYRLRDTKLARSVKVEALLQLAAYAETLTAAGIAVHDEVELVLGNAPPRPTGWTSCCRSTARAASNCKGCWTGTSPAMSRSAGRTTPRARMRCPECEAQVRERDDLLLVAGMRVSQRARLIDAGITTVADLAVHYGPVADMPARAVAALRGKPGCRSPRR